MSDWLYANDVKTLSLCRCGGTSKLSYISSASKYVDLRFQITSSGMLDVNAKVLAFAAEDFIILHSRLCI